MKFGRPGRRRLPEKISWFRKGPGLAQKRPRNGPGGAQKGSETVREKPKKAQKWSGRSPEIVREEPKKRLRGGPARRFPKVPRTPPRGTCVVVCAQVQRTLPTHPPTSQPWAGLGFYNIVCKYSSGRGRYGPPLTKSWGTPREGLSVPPRSIGLFGGFRFFFARCFQIMMLIPGLQDP